MTALLEYLDLERCKTVLPFEYEKLDSNPLITFLLLPLIHPTLTESRSIPSSIKIVHSCDHVINNHITKIDAGGDGKQGMMA